MSVTLLDTPALAPRYRDIATREVMETLAELDMVRHVCPPEAIRTRVRAWDLHNLQLTVMENRWLRYGLNSRATTETVSIAAQISGQTARSYGEHRRLFAPGEISLLDCSSPFQSWSAESSTHMSFRCTFAELCLPAATIRSAEGDLTTSPLYELFQTHLLQLYRFLSEEVPAAAVESLGSATLELARAVIATIGQDDLARNDVANQALLTRVEAYVQQHLRDPALSPESIAQAHHISVRQLYKVWSAREVSLAEWIMRGRLEGARHDIAKDGSAGIAVIARRWGFIDPAHFGRRFSSAYGLSPREWKRAQSIRDSVRTLVG